MAVISVGIRGSDQRLVNSFQRNSARVQTSVERLSTGKRINRPEDDPAGFVAAEQLRKELGDLKVKLKQVKTDRQESRRSQSGLANIQQTLTELRDRVVAANDTSITAAEREALVVEIDETAAALDRVAEITGLKSVPKVFPSSGVDNGVKQGTELPSADELSGHVDGIVGRRIAEGTQERIDQVFEELYSDQIVITTETLSMIEDTDYAAETSALAQAQVLTQGAIAALGYSNQQRIDQIEMLLDELI